MDEMETVNRIGDVYDYFRLLHEVLVKADWELCETNARLFSIEGPHAALPYLHIENYDERDDRAYLDDEGFDQIVCLHLQTLYYLHVAENFENAYAVQTQIMQVFNKEIIQKKKEENWFMPIFYQLCTDLRTLAKKVDEMVMKEEDEEGENETSCYEQSASFIMEAFRACVSDVRNDPDTTKKVAILNMTNQLFRIYFKINKLNLLKPLIRAVENAESSGLYDSFSMADKVSYRYFLGRKAMFDAKLALAESSLLYAFRNCPPEYVENKRRILIYLIPVKMFLGQMPHKQLLHKYELDQFVQIVDAVRKGNVKKLDEALWQDETFFIQCGIYLMLEKLRAIAFRKLFKFCSALVETHMVHLDVFLTALRLQGVTDIDCDELECIIANLIYDGRIKGYLSHQHKKLVLSKKEPFPPLSSIYM